MKKVRLALCAVVAICSAGLASADVRMFDAWHPTGLPDMDSQFGRHIWTTSHLFICPQLSQLGPGLRCIPEGRMIAPGVGAMVTGAAVVDDKESFIQHSEVFIQLRFDDGRAGFIEPYKASSFQSEEAHAQALAKQRAWQAKTDADEAKLKAESDAYVAKGMAEAKRMVKEAERCSKARYYIGMSETEAKAKLCKPGHINRTVTATGNRAQWVYEGLPGEGNGYLYFEDGRLVAFQQRDE
jgi:hypothetical protein